MVSNPTSSSTRRKKAKVEQKTDNAEAEARHQRRLPFEIWSLVFSFLPLDDLTRVARVSATFLPICRFAIYRSLNLRNDNQTYPYTFNLLKHIKGLASSVRHATLFTAWTTWIFGLPAATWLDFEVVARFSGLHTLTFIGCPFVVEAEQTQFVEIIGRVSPSLKGFTYVPYYLTAFPGLLFELRGLETVSWPSYLASSPEPQCLSLLIASSQTITTLSFPTCPGYPIARRGADPDTWIHLLALHFPNLVSFSLGLLYPERISDRRHDTTHLVTRFLLAHPRLEHVALGCSTQFAHLYEGISGRGELVTPDFLPALRRLETHPTNLAVMLRQRVRVLQTLTRLVLSYFCMPQEDERGGPLAELLQALEGTPGLPFVEDLGVNFSGSFGEIEPMAVQWVRRLGAYFPAVLSWSGHLGVVSPADLSEALAPYNLVKTVNMPNTTLVATQNGGILSADDFVPIADACPQLGFLVIKTQSQQTQSTKHVLDRNDDGTLGSVIVNPR